MATEEDLIQLTALPSELTESSGLIFFDQKLWSHNDSGDQARIYNISTGQALTNQILNFANAQHIDWEDLAQDEQFLYIGDFGNNSGQRQDLVIYKIAKNGLSDTSEVIEIRFNFSDQFNFDHSFEMHNFNCEAMIVQDHFIYLFSKNHLDQKTKLYRLPNSPGYYSASLIEEFDSRGLITAADLDEDTNTLCLLGYTTENSEFQTFLWLFFDFEAPNFRDGTSRRISLPIHQQAEGICSIGNGEFYISNENEDGLGAWLYVFDTKTWK